MKTTLIIIGAIALVLYAAGTSISFKPFKITVETPYLPFAAIFLIMALVCYNLQYKKIGFKEGHNKGLSEGYELGYKNCRDNLYKTIDLTEKE